MKRFKNRGWILFSIVNSIFFAFQIAGFMLHRDPGLRWGLSSCLILFFGSIIPGSALGILGAYFLERMRDRREESIFARYEDGWLVEGYRNLGELTPEPAPPASIAWLIILVSYIPGFLAFYPGICAYDAYIQIYQIISGQWNDHHPILHTRLLGLFWNIGTSTGNPTTGIALFSAFQIICLSAAFAYSIAIMKKLGCGKVWFWILTGFGALFPYSVFIGLSVTKAGLFTAAFLPALTLLLYFVKMHRASLKPERKDIWYIILLTIAITFRNNAMYAMAVLSLILLVVSIVLFVGKKLYASLYFRLFLMTVTAVILAGIMMAGASKLWNVTPGDKREMLSIPVQQMARAVDYNQETMKPIDMEVVDSFILDEGWRLYDPLISDPVKRNVNTWYAVNYPAETLGAYFRLLAAHPDDYVNAFLAQNAGYLYIFDRSCLSVYGDGEGYGFIQTKWPDEIYSYGVVKAPVIPVLGEILEKLASDNILQRIPVIGILFVPGYVIWAFVYLGLTCWYRKKTNRLVPICAAILFIGTLLLGPTVQMRYIYPVWVFIPFLMAGIYRRKKS